jgi:surface carbohydrate biosynthesis protein
VNNTVFLPIEITQREFASKLLLAIELIKKGMPVIIGHKGPVLKLALEAKQPGIFFNKGTSAGGLENIHELLKKKNFGFVAQDEEAGIIFDNFNDFYINRPALRSVNKLDLFFTWGQEEFNFLIKKFGKNIVKNYGGLRSCFWGDFGKTFYQSNTDSLKKKYGNYILIASNLATYNSSLGKDEDYKREIKSWGKFFKPEAYKELFENEKKIFFQYKDLIEFISKKFNKTVILRPHPSESKQVWQDTLKGIKNVFVEKKGDLLPWILASDFLIQNNCTSAIEASTVGIPVVTYADEIEDLKSLSEGKDNIPNKLSINIFGKKQFVEKMNDINLIWNKDENQKSREKLLKRKLKDYGSTKAAENIAQKIIEYVGTPNPKGNENLGKDSMFYGIYELFRKLRPKTKSTIMDINKRETLSYDRVQKDIIHLMSIMKVDKKIKMKRIGPNTFYLYPLEADIEK